MLTKRNTQLLVVSIGILTGLGLARIVPVFGLQALAVAIIAGLIVRRRPLLLLLSLTAFGVALGGWRGVTYRQQLDAYQPLYMHTITLRARATEDAVYGKTKQLGFAANDVRLASGRHLTGKVQLGGFGVNAVFVGDEVTATGKLYPGYGAYQGRLSFAAIHVSAHHPTVVNSIRRKFIAGAQSALPEPLAPFVMGLLVGQRATLPAQTKQDLQRVGLTHIIAVSGYNLTIILQASRRVFSKRSKRLSTLLSLLLMFTFLLLAGASASIVRAVMVSLLSMAAGYYGRTLKPLSLLCFAAAVTALGNPVYIWSDLSWYLSFLAFFGVMIISPLVQSRWPYRWQQTLVGSVALESVCAELMSLPFVLYIFGQMSLVGLPANILVVSLVPLAMLLGVVAGLAGMLLGPIAGWFTWPAKLLLTYMLDIAHLMASIPHSFVQNRSLPLQMMLGLYGIIGVVALVVWHKTNDKNAVTITDTS